MGKGVFNGLYLTLSSLALIYQLIGFIAPAWMRYHQFVDYEKFAKLIPPNLNLQTGALINKGSQISGTDPAGNGMVPGANPFGLPPGAPMKLTVDLSVGLWFAHGCTEAEGHMECRTVSIKEAMAAMQTSQNTAASSMVDFLTGKFIKLQILCTLGGLAALTGFVSVFLFLRADALSGVKCKGIICASAWALSAILVFIAVDIEVQQNQILAVGSDIMEKIPAFHDAVNVEFYSPWAIYMSAIGAFLAAVICIIVCLRMCKITESGGGKDGNWIKLAEVPPA